MKIRARLPHLVVFLTAGCAYYNGLYNANQLAKQAQKAESEGRRSEAQSLWAQAAVKAELVATRYPSSSHRDDALLVQGRALSEIGECGDAIEPLRTVGMSSPDANIRAEAGLLLGECHLENGHPDSALSVLTPLVNHADSALASRALLWRGRASLAVGAPGDALSDLRRTAESGGVLDRALSLTELGRVREAAAALDTARAFSVEESQWSVVLDRLGKVDPVSASAIVTRLMTQDGLTSGSRARFLISDGLRWIKTDQSYAADRFTAAQAVAGDSLEGRLARAQLVLGKLRRTTDLERAGLLTEELGLLMLEGGEVVNMIGRYEAILRSALATAEEPGGEYSDLRLFRRAEQVRDVLSAKPLAAELFLTVARRHPGSVLAPKGLLAAARLRPEIDDSVHMILQSGYPDSPYTEAVAGVYGPRYQTVEDSIRSLLDGALVGRR